MSLLTSLAGLLKDPPPAYAFEVSEAGIAVAELARPPRMSFAATGAGGDLRLSIAGQRVAPRGGAEPGPRRGAGRRQPQAAPRGADPAGLRGACHGAGLRQLPFGRPGAGLAGPLPDEAHGAFRRGRGGVELSRAAGPGQREASGRGGGGGAAGNRGALRDSLSAGGFPSGVGDDLDPGCVGIGPADRLERAGQADRPDLEPGGAGPRGSETGPLDRDD